MYLVGIGVETNTCTHSDNEHGKLDKYYLLLTCLKCHTKYLGLPIIIVAAVTREELGSDMSNVNKQTQQAAIQQYTKKHVPLQ